MKKLTPFLVALAFGVFVLTSCEEDINSNCKVCHIEDSNGVNIGSLGEYCDAELIENEGKTNVDPEGNTSTIVCIAK